MLDDNGDGVADSGDGLLASNIYLRGTLTWGLRPEVTGVDVIEVLEEASATPISVQVVRGDRAVERVWVKVIGPDVDISGGDQTITYPEVELEYKWQTGRYEGLLTGLSREGIYTLVVFAEDVEHEVSDPVIAYVSVAEPVQAGDVDGDGDIGLSDVILALKVFCGGNVSAGGEVKVGADVNGDGRIGMEEVIYILRTLANPTP